MFDFKKRTGEFLDHFENDIWNKIGLDISNAYENNERDYKVNLELLKYKYSFNLYKKMFEDKLALYLPKNEYSVEVYNKRDQHLLGCDINIRIIFKM